MVTVVASLPAAGQTSTSGSKSAPVVKAAAAIRTPWGDPDLQGTWCGDSAQAIPPAAR
jgi:hypothetical protein